MRVVVFFLDENRKAIIQAIQLSYVDAEDVQSILSHGYVGHPDDSELLLGIPAHKIVLIQEIEK